MQHWVRICAPCRWSEESQGRNSVAAGEFRGRYRAPGKVQDGGLRNRRARGIGSRQPIGPDFSRKLLGFGMYQSLCCKSILTRISTYVDYLPIIEPVQDYAATVQPVQPAHVNSVSTQQFEKRNRAPIRNPAQTSGPGDHTSSVDRPGLLPDVHVQWDDMLSPTRQDLSNDIIDNNLYMYGTDNANSHTPVTETNTKHYYNGFMGGRSLVGPSVYQGMDSSVPSYDVAIDLSPSAVMLSQRRLPLSCQSPRDQQVDWPAMLVCHLLLIVLLSPLLTKACIHLCQVIMLPLAADPVVTPSQRGLSLSCQPPRYHQVDWPTMLEHQSSLMPLVTTILSSLPCRTICSKGIYS